MPDVDGRAIDDAEVALREIADRPGLDSEVSGYLLRIADALSEHPRPESRDERAAAPSRSA